MLFRLSDGSRRSFGTLLPSDPTALAISPRGDQAIVGGEQGVFALLRLPDGASVWEHWELRAQERASVAFSPDGALVAATTLRGDHNLVLLDAKTGAVLTNPLGFGNSRGTVAFAPSGRLLAVGTHEGARLLRLPERTPLPTITRRAMNSHTMGVAFAPMGDELVFGLLWGRMEVVCDPAAAPP